MNSQSINAQWNDLVLPEQQTELYFTEQANMPDTYVPGVEQSFKFSFVNQERRTVKYTFEVVATDSSGKQHVIGTGSTEAPNNQRGTVTPKFKISNLGKRVKISVALKYELPEAGGASSQSKSISFWVERSSDSTDKFA